MAVSILLSETVAVKGNPNAAGMKRGEMLKERYLIQP